MIHRAVLAVFLASLLGFGTLTVHASGSAEMTISPAKVLDGSRITVKASRLQPGHYYTFLLVGPKTRKDRALVGLAQADASGKLAKLFKLPVILHCGKSTVYLFDSKRVLAHAPVKITGCTIKGGPGAPPPAPHKG